jgi:hypothetical protein
LVARSPLAAVFTPTKRVKTGSSGKAGLQFNDQSNLSVGPSSQVRLDKFVYDPSKGGGSAVIEATRGTFRFTSGSQNGGQVTIKTPHGMLGVRG